MITLIGKELAKEGVSFIFYGAVEECSDCRFKASCVDSLKEGHRYTITEVRDVEQKCPIHECEKVKVVVVENGEFTILTDSKGIFEGSSFDFNRKGCSNKDCDFRDMCFPEGISKEEKGFYVKDLGKFKDCPCGNSLEKCIVKIHD
ncbi:hypothetical protein SAMN02910297_00768 [Methanobrevibacter olleyae]|uniref:UPF0179 protein SAMN02910297_00768 n=1 Tax=Methanobrevibacter olleyae TaxID=294671 RepID=A0A1I4HDX8_METOL|nr:UPF0179 family protein [Methanobrevibacter olleyae]SFL39596.1 hypothetical protein SAMN02910297_00768 [Methanobrevibacter olleyae]